MKYFNLLFYIMLFIGFALPSNSSYVFKFPGINLQIREIAFLLLPIINILGKSSYSVKTGNKKIKYLIFIFFAVLIFLEIIKALYYNNGLDSVYKTLRIGLPLFSSLILIYTGIRVNILKVWSTLLLAISVSTILTVISLFISLPIYPVIEDTDYLSSSSGRLLNANAPFGVIGLYLLYKDKNEWYNTGLLVKIASIFSVISLILTFNRTYLLLTVLSVIYLTIRTFSLKEAIKYLLIPTVVVIIVFWVYNSFDIIQRQIDRRIFGIVFGDTELIASVFEDNREVILEGVMERIDEGYWLFGLPLNIPIFTWYRNTGIFPMSVTDTTFVNVLLRYGFFSLLILISIFRKMLLINKSTIFTYIMIFYLIASINIDALMRHNSILFLIIVFFISKNNLNEQNINAGSYQWSRLRR